VSHLEHATAELFTQDAIWRDSFALTGSLRTFYTAAIIEKVWKKLCLVHKPTNFRVVDGSCRTVTAGQDSSWIEARFVFDTQGTPPTTCSGFVSLVYHLETGWKIWVLRTILEQLSGYGDVDSLKPPGPLANGSPETPYNAQDKSHFECVIIGGGQSGLSTAGRLKALGVDYLVVDKNHNVGDSWKLRYDSTKRRYPRLWHNFDQS